MTTGGYVCSTFSTVYITVYTDLSLIAKSQNVYTQRFSTSPRGGVRSNAISVSVCLPVSLCLSAGMSQKRHSKPHETLLACYPGPWPGPVLTTMKYFVDTERECLT